jgi:hypothetical protein
LHAGPFDAADFIQRYKKLFPVQPLTHAPLM